MSGIRQFHDKKMDSQHQSRPGRQVTDVKEVHTDFGRQCHKFRRGVCQYCGVVAFGNQWSPNKVTKEVEQLCRDKIKEALKKCPKCLLVFEDFNRCHLHQTSVHKGPQLEWCTDCDTVFACEVALGYHTYYEHPGK